MTVEPPAEPPVERPVEPPVKRSVERPVGSPVEPPPCAWRLPDPADADEHDICGVGADLAPGTILAAYRRGLFPMHVDAEGRMLGWWAPDPRGVIPLDGFHTSRSLRRSRRRFEVTVDAAFAEVMAACAEPRVGSAVWIRPEVAAAYTELHHLGWAHSVEAWEGGQLVGGVYGLAIGGLFAGESMFHRRADAGKAALAHLVEVVGADGDPRRLLDIQWVTPHLASMGAVAVPGPEYQRRLAAALPAPLPPAFAG